MITLSGARGLGTLFRDQSQYKKRRDAYWKDQESSNEHNNLRFKEASSLSSVMTSIVAKI
ncbi:protein of unknown function (plasmid) [Caballeronia sp. S22]